MVVSKRLLFFSKGEKN